MKRPVLTSHAAAPIGPYSQAIVVDDRFIFTSGQIPVDPATGWIIDFAEIDRAWQPIHDLLDHRYLNEVEGLDNPTSELLARWILERMRLPNGKLRAVTVAETCCAACTVYDESG